MIQLDCRSRTKNPTPTPTSTPSVVRNDTPTPHKNFRLFATPTPTPQPWYPAPTNIFSYKYLFTAWNHGVNGLELFVKIHPPAWIFWKNFQISNCINFAKQFKCTNFAKKLKCFLKNASWRQSCITVGILARCTCGSICASVQICCFLCKLFGNVPYYCM